MRIFFSVGEPSGDQHAAELIRELRRRRPEIIPTGFGGPLMQPLIEEAGGDFVYPLTDLAVMGFTRVVPMLGKFYRLVRRAEQIFRTDPPAAVVLEDDGVRLLRLGKPGDCNSVEGIDGIGSGCGVGGA